jgi:hypothetical protein
VYNNWLAGPPSIAGHAHTALLQTGAWARVPLLGRIPLLRVPDINFVYGVGDWMSPESGFQVQAAVQARADGGVGGGVDSTIATHPAVTVSMVGNAGHQALLDAPLQFVAAVVAAIRGDPCDGVTF